jgi:uncharacterized Zn-binding protein involved in type VI secretion
MGFPAARVGDMHTCPMFDGPKPHVGGPVLPPGKPTVFIGNMPAARMGDMCSCVGPPDVIAKGSPTVFIGGQMAARVTDTTLHGGVITVGAIKTFIGDGKPKTDKPECHLAAADRGSATIS